MLAPGDVLGGDFEIEAPLGRGGMGAVFLARQRSTDALRAVKIMLPEWAVSPALRERFEREARASGRILSDHVVKIIAHGVDLPRRIPWIAMEYLTGSTLEERVASLGVPPSHTSFELLRQLFHGVAAAHAVGIVHRDLKPPNVHVSESYRADVPFTVKVLDFGIAKMLASGPHETRALGTRAWMAPEQADTNGVVGPSSDVWALGLLTFWLLTGRHFWKNAEGSEIELLHEVHFATIPSGDARLTELGLPPLGAAFSEWLGRCLRREPERRFQDAAAAWSALAPVFSELSSESPWSRAFRGARGPRTLPTPPLPSVAAHSPRTGNFTPAPVARDRPSSLPQNTLVRWTLLSMAVTVTIIVVLAGYLGHDRLAPLLASVAGTSVEAVHGGSLAEPPLPIVSLAAEAPPGMVYVAAGSFEMGTGDDEPSGPVHVVHVSQPFFLDILETSAKDYDACVLERACTPAGVHGPSITPAEVVQYQHACNGTRPGRERHPINCVDQEQATAFCRHRGKRLPTEAEWEFAARGADRRAFPWGNEEPSTCDLAVVAGVCRTTGTEQVGTRAVSSVSPRGALDMAGNVGEWVQDSWDADAYRTAPASDPLVSAPSTFGILRGGSWDLPASAALTTSRQRFDKREGHVNSGIRCARSAPR